MATERFRLTDRHLELLQGLADGMDNADLREALGVSKYRIWDLSQEVRSILGASTTIHAVVLAVELGLIETEHGQGGRLKRVREHASAISELLT